MASIVLSFLVSERFLILTGFLGLSMVISSITGFSLLERLLTAIGVEKKETK